MILETDVSALSDEKLLTEIERLESYISSEGWEHDVSEQEALLEDCKIELNRRTLP